MSDIHVDINALILGIERKHFLKILCDYLIDLKDSYDVLLFVGDLSNDMLYSLKILNTIDECLNKEKIIKFVPGNHDLYFNKSYGNVYISSEEMLNFYKESCYSLVEPFKLTDNTTLIGGLGWFDYSFFDLYLGDKKEELGLDSEFDKYCSVLKYEYWDGIKLDFIESDSTICKNENTRYENLLNEFKDKDIFLINHFVPFYRYVKTNRSNEVWNACNAFIGSDNLGSIIESNKNVKYVAFGHTHYRYGVNNIGERLEICVPLGYFGEWSEFINLSEKYNLEESNLCNGNLEEYIKNELTLAEKSLIIKKELENLNTIIEIN